MVSRALDVQEDVEDPFAAREILLIMYDISKGLAYLHQNHIIHR